MKYIQRKLDSVDAVLYKGHLTQELIDLLKKVPYQYTTGINSEIYINGQKVSVDTYIILHKNTLQVMNRIQFELKFRPLYDIFDK